MTERCARCGRPRDDADPAARLAWVRDTDERGTRWYCPECAREHLRSIEAKLTSDWW
ncbi:MULTISPECIES: hypothetical protein [Actinokineospora]|uniref:Uncharacterized protein n=1 Tax=Actinokineospora fastidiosa TaxID=1816 RepID=A0A918GM46_9PSEU|nr:MULTISPECIES: hypothetical protein [Actinokineospora]UVS77273.1 hypothetical protein Actkin_00978 [Actinokineospora sp. UTMC 2448]GGS44441.1 hypothetical protein GCM10010171_44560 [Actinokineospora fastidiosa]